MKVFRSFLLCDSLSGASGRRPSLIVGQNACSVSYRPYFQFLSRVKETNFTIRLEHRKLKPELFKRPCLTLKFVHIKFCRSSYVNNRRSNRENEIL